MNARGRVASLGVNTRKCYPLHPLERNLLILRETASGQKVLPLQVTALGPILYYLLVTARELQLTELDYKI